MNQLLLRRFGEEAFDVSDTTDGVRDHEAQQAHQAQKVAIASPPTHEGLPVVVEGFDAACWWMVLTERSNGIEVFEQTLMQFPHRYVCTSGSSAQHLLEAKFHLGSSFGAQNVSELLLFVVGCNWSRYVDYHTPQAISAADGAAAVVLGVPTRTADANALFEVVDHETATHAEYFGSMFMQGDRRETLPGSKPGAELWTPPYFHITAAGQEGFKTVGVGVAASVASTVMQRSGLTGADVALIGHQASRVLLDQWTKELQPACVVETIAKFANMTVANIAVNLAWSKTNLPIVQDHLVLLALGPDMHANAILLRRGAARS